MLPPSARTRALYLLISIAAWGCGGCGDQLELRAPCAPGTWDSDGAAGTACVAWTVCAPGTYVQSAGAADSDRGCAACAAGTFSAQTNATACAAWTGCGAGNYVGVPGTATADAVCAACPSGAFSSTADAAQCTPWTDCAAGEHVVVPGTAAADRTCAACAAGEYSTGANASTCQPATACLAGTRQTAPATATSPVQCAACEPGTYCAGGGDAQIACGAGTWDDDASAASPCIAWTTCSPGFRVAAEGAAVGDRSCAACDAGTYSDADNADACLPIGACAAGSVQTAPGTATSATACQLCDAGFYCAGGTAERLACAAGTWDHDASAATACAAWTDCPAGQYVAAAGSAVGDRTCAACASGDTTSTMNAASCSPGAWLLSYFGPAQDVANDSIHLAYSLDGQTWPGLAYHQPVYQLSGLGTDHIRDPFIFRKNDGSFVYLATDWTLAENDSGYWSHPSPRVFVADSADLITFTNPRLLTVTDLPGPGGGPMHAWAPEAYYDAERGAYAIVWSGNNTSGNNQIYVTYTLDFSTVLNPTPDVLFDPGYSVIDATIERADGRRYLFFKDESDGNGAPENRGKDIQIARAPSLALDPGAFSMWSTDYVTRGTAQTVRQATEGPFAIYQPEQGRWILYADYYVNGGVFGAWTSPSLDAAPSAWTALPAQSFSFPTGVRHAHAVRITVDELDALIARYGVSRRLRSTYSENTVPFYVAHSWFHGLITPLADRERGQLADDFLWKVVPGLADPSDPDLVSFEAVGYPGRYLRIDSANPARYPSCDEASNRSWALCWVAEADRHHLLWLDAYTDTATFRGDASFRRVPALNGDASMISLQWYPDASRYLRHMAYQVFATPISGDSQQNDASFVLERE